MVKVFKTNVKNKKQANEVLREMKTVFPEAALNFDLEDCDKVFRIESETISSESVLQFIRQAGFKGEELQ